MSWYEIKQAIDELSNAWENFKSNNEKRLQSIEQKKLDTILESQLNTLNKEIDYCKEKIKKFLIHEKRPNIFDTDLDKPEEQKNFIQYIRYGTHPKNIETKTTQALIIDPSAILLPEIYRGIIDITSNQSIMRKIASVTKIYKSESFDYISYDSTDSSKWLSSPGVNTKEPSSGTMNRNTIQLFTLCTQPAISKTVLEDLNFDIEEWLIECISNNFSSVENKAFINGDGSTEPAGIISGQVMPKLITPADATKLSADDFFKAYYDISPSYSDNITFLMHPTLITQIRSIKDQNGRYIWYPGTDHDSLFGAKLYAESSLNPVANKWISCIVGNFKKGYKIVDRAGIEIIRDPYTYKPNVLFYVSKTVGGKTVNADALRLFALGATPPLPK